MTAQQALTMSLNATPQRMPFTSTIFDVAGGFQSASNSYVIPVSGVYEVGAGAPFNAASSTIINVINIYKNGSSIAAIAGNLTTAIPAYLTATRQFQFVAGDVIALYASVSSGTAAVPADAPTTYFSVKRLSGPSIIAATETVVASYVLTPPTAVASNAIVKFDTKLKDSHNAYNTTTGVFTVPISGQYRVSGVGQNSVTGTSFYLALSSGNGLYMNAMPNAGVGGGSVSIPLLAGQTVSVKLDIGGTLTGVVSGNYVTSFSIERTGN
jgi:hypothetical protein